ncbi:MAG: arylsulfatase, partial [Pseudomonadales bacterium]
MSGLFTAFTRILCAGLVLSTPLTVYAMAKTPAARPNILLIVVDDMGFADLGSFGGEIDTPHLDRLALAGVRLTNFHVAPTCSTTRSMLLTGVDSHKAGLGNMLEELADNQKGKPGYEGYLNDRVVTLPTLMRDAGYRTYMSGKWHLGLEEEQSPAARGFDKSFALTPGGASHFADMRPAYAPTPEAKAKYRQDGKLLQKLPENFNYSSQFYGDQLITYIDEDKKSKQPFFAYLSFTAPHWPLQAPDDAIKKYAGRYDAGYDVLLERRLQKLKVLGLLPKSATAGRRAPGAVPWNDLNNEEKKVHARAMEVYAAMIDQIDFHTGRLLDYLEKNGQLENTAIVFMSDNGPDGHDLDQTWPADQFPKIRKVIDETHDFRYANMGKPGSYVLYGPNWARVGSPAFRWFKAFPTEGGSRVTAFVHYPKRYAGGAVNNGLASVKDITPTVLEWTGVAHPGTRYQKRPIEPVTG